MLPVTLTEVPAGTFLMTSALRQLGLLNRVGAELGTGEGSGEGPGDGPGDGPGEGSGEGSEDG